LKGSQNSFQLDYVVAQNSWKILIDMENKLYTAVLKKLSQLPKNIKRTLKINLNWLTKLDKLLALNVTEFIPLAKGYWLSSLWYLTYVVLLSNKYFKSDVIPYFDKLYARQVEYGWPNLLPPLDIMKQLMKILSPFIQVDNLSLIVRSYLTPFSRESLSDTLKSLINDCLIATRFPHLYYQSCGV
jgi:hypothetical protein